MTADASEPCQRMEQQRRTTGALDQFAFRWNETANETAILGRERKSFAACSKRGREAVGNKVVERRRTKRELIQNLSTARDWPRRPLTSRRPHCQVHCQGWAGEMASAQAALRLLLGQGLRSTRCYCVTFCVGRSLERCPIRVSLHHRPVGGVPDVRPIRRAHVVAVAVVDARAAAAYRSTPRRRRPTRRTPGAPAHTHTHTR